MRKNPMYAQSDDLRYGDLMEEIRDNVGASGGTVTTVETAIIIPLAIPVARYAYRAASWALGEQGSICTMTAECMNRCK